jgi:quinol monooxygenase YgiN
MKPGGSTVVSSEILSVAVFEPLAGHEEQALATVRELSSVLAASGHSRDVLYRGPDGEYVLVRHWKSDETRRAAMEDPNAQRCWAKLAHEIRIVKVYESLEEVELG